MHSMYLCGSGRQSRVNIVPFHSLFPASTDWLTRDHIKESSFKKNAHKISPRGWWKNEEICFTIFFSVCLKISFSRKKKKQISLSITFKVKWKLMCAIIGEKQKNRISPHSAFVLIFFRDLTARRKKVFWTFHRWFFEPKKKKFSTVKCVELHNSEAIKCVEKWENRKNRKHAKRSDNLSSAETYQL